MTLNLWVHSDLIDQRIVKFYFELPDSFFMAYSKMRKFGRYENHDRYQ